MTRRLEILDLPLTAVKRSAELMTLYSDLPMDLVDATLVAIAEAHGVRRVFTLDSDFWVYRLPGDRHFEILPMSRQ